MRRFFTIMAVMIATIVTSNAQTLQFQGDLRTYPNNVLFSPVEITMDINIHATDHEFINSGQTEDAGVRFMVSAVANGTIPETVGAWSASFVEFTEYAEINGSENFHADGSAKMKNTYVFFSHDKHQATQFFTITQDGKKTFLCVRCLYDSQVQWMAWVDYDKKLEGRFYDILRQAVKKLKFHRTRAE